MIRLFCFRTFVLMCIHQNKHSSFAFVYNETNWCDYIVRTIANWSSMECSFNQHEKRVHVFYDTSSYHVNDEMYPWLNELIDDSWKDSYTFHTSLYYFFTISNQSNAFLMREIRKTRISLEYVELETRIQH